MTVSSHVVERSVAAADCANPQTSSPTQTVGLLGLPNDMNSTFVRGPAAAPPALRAALNCESANLYAELGDCFGEVVRDCGDAALPARATPAQADVCLETAVSTMLCQGLTPLLVGGDHSVTYPAFRALAKHCKGRMAEQQLVIVHFDAHPDLYEDVGTFMHEVSERYTVCCCVIRQFIIIRKYIIDFATACSPTPSRMHRRSRASWKVGFAPNLYS